MLISRSYSSTTVFQSSSNNSIFPDYLTDDPISDHHLPFDFQQDNSHEDDCTPGPSFSQGPSKEPDILSTRDNNINLQSFARLSELQFDLHQHRGRLLVADGLVFESLPEVPSLDLVLGTIDQVREVVDGIMRREDLTRPAHDSSAQQAVELLPYSSGLKLLALIIIRESLDVHQILIGIASNSKFLKSAMISGGDLLPISSQMTKADSSARFNLGSLTTSEKMNQILVLTIIDLHIISFHKFLHSYLSDEAISEGATSSLLDAKTTLRQIQLNLMVILEVSKASNASHSDSTSSVR